MLLPTNKATEPSFLSSSIQSDTKAANTGPQVSETWEDREQTFQRPLCKTISGIRCPEKKETPQFPNSVTEVKATLDKHHWRSTGPNFLPKGTETLTYNTDCFSLAGMYVLVYGETRWILLQVVSVEKKWLISGDHVHTGLNPHVENMEGLWAYKLPLFSNIAKSLFS